MLVLNKRTETILTVSLVAITAIGLLIGTWLYVSQDKYINRKVLVLSDKEQTEMEVWLGGIAPGVDMSYTIDLKANRGDGFDVLMQFEPDVGNSLAKFLDVEVLVEGQSVGKGSLIEFLDGRSLSFRADFKNKPRVEVTFIYSMGIDVGDEAQGATADFDIILTSKR